jgi:long-chain fatty acid transport protein
MMKKTGLIYVFATLICALMPITAFASRLNQEDGILPNHSADYVRTLNRNASTSADAAFYNPAGLAFLDYKGLTVHFSTQTYYAKRVHTMDYYGIQYASNPMIPTSNFLNKANGLPKEYLAETLAPVLPGFELIWKEDKWAVYLDVGVTQAAPGMTFNQGLAVVDWGILAPFETTYAGFGGVSNNIMGVWRNAKAVRTEYYYQATVGGVYKIADWVSGALGVRCIYATANQNITVKYAGVAAQTPGGYNVAYTLPWVIDTDTKGIGTGIILGFHFKPIDILDIGFKSEYYPPMVLKKKTNKFFAPGVVASSGNLNIFADGWKSLLMEKMFDPSGYDPSRMTPMNLKKYKKEVKSTLKVTYPWTFSLGASVKIWKGLRAELSGEIQLRKFRDLDGREDMFNTFGYRMGGCLEWTFLPKTTVSVGYVFNDFGIKKDQRNEVDPLLRSHSIGGGFAFGVSEWLDITVGGMYMMYMKERVYSYEYSNVTGATIHALSKSFDEKRMSVAIGFTVKLFGSSGAPKNDDMSIKLQKGGG